MILKGLEMQGFKSFPDKTRLDFGKGITAVVGPNGSGKSNISDAVRWVLGEQSTKNLRGSKMEDVIFGGTSLRKATSFAKVTLHLDNRDRSLNRDDDTVSVTRQLFRSGESEYKINGEDCRLRDIHELFMDTGLGRDGYSMVGQGRIADLVSSKSSQRRDMLEEAAGISHYRYRRNDATRSLERAEENLIRLRDILTELEGRVGPLKIQSEKAVKFLALSDEKKALEIGLWLHTIEKSTRLLSEQEYKLSIAVNQYDKTEEELDKLSQEIEKTAEHSREITVRIEEMTREMSSLDEMAAVVEGNINVEKNSAENNLSIIERIRRDMESGEKSVADIENSIAEIDISVKEKREAVGRKEGEKKLLVDKMYSLIEKAGSGDEKAASLARTAAQLNAENADLRVQISALESACGEAKERVNAVDEILLSKKALFDEALEKKAGAENEVKKNEESLSENSNALEGLRMIQLSRQSKEKEKSAELEQLRLKIYQKNARIKMLDDLEKNLDGYAGSVQKVIKHAQQGALHGIRGAVSQLITVEPEYTVAVETALGAAIQNIVTDDENAAKRAINYLKENRLGRATFLPLTSVKAKQFTENGLSSCRGFVDMAVNLINADREYDAVFSSLLAKTAVVDNIDNAIAMAKKYSYRFKIVTLDGQVINAGGSITGGSRGSGSGLLSRVNEIEALKEEVISFENNLKEKEKAYKTLAEDLAAVDARLQAGEADGIRLQEDLIRAQSALSLAKGNFDSISAQIDELEEEKNQKTEKIAQYAADIENAGNKLRETETLIEKINGEISIVNRSKEEFDLEREKNLSLQNEISLEILSLNKELEAALDSRESLISRKADASTRNDSLLEEIASYEKRNEEILINIEKLESEKLSLKEKAKMNSGAIEALAEERTQDETATVRLRAKERSLTCDREKLVGERARLEERRDSLSKELENTKNRLLDEYSLSVRQAGEIAQIPDDIASAQKQLAEIRNKIRALGSVNVGAVEEYKEVSERYNFMSAQLGDIEKSKQELEKQIASLTEKMAEKFKEQFRLINTSFTQTFRDLFGGGTAELVPDDPKDMLECNISIKVQPPGKKVQNIDLLSGGEKGLSAIALLIAILKINPAPFCIFDEVEAALDDVNVQRYAQYLRSMNSKIQFILITHRRGTMDEADILYGVTMQEEGVSKLLELKSAEMARKLGLEN
ncbi:MAG: chromosome segregation protein SMC [Clostridiales bacterium]|nr:chromosome segregation protein SMC [Clostridiales bacterium]